MKNTELGATNLNQYHFSNCLPSICLKNEEMFWVLRSPPLAPICWRYFWDAKFGSQLPPFIFSKSRSIGGEADCNTPYNKKNSSFKLLQEWLVVIMHVNVILKNVIWNSLLIWKFVHVIFRKESQLFWNLRSFEKNAATEIRIPYVT